MTSHCKNSCSMFSLQTAVLDTDDGAVLVLKHTSTLGTSKIHHFGFNIKKCNFGDQDIFTKNVIYCVFLYVTYARPNQSS